LKRVQSSRSFLHAKNKKFGIRRTDCHISQEVFPLVNESVIAPSNSTSSSETSIRNSSQKEIEGTLETNSPYRSTSGVLPPLTGRMWSLREKGNRAPATLRLPE
jgi:hypothetical protein